MRDLNEDEKIVIKEIEKRGEKNKMTFLLTEKTAVKQEDVERIEFINKSERMKLTEVIPETWKEDYKELRKKAEEDSKRTRKLPGKTIPTGITRVTL